jgi:trimethylamine-N-oxide reductase (cytochrome c)
MRNMDSWEGYSWGSKNVWGGEPVGEMQPSANVWPDIAKHSELLLFWAADPETTPVGFDGYMSSRLNKWLHSIGIKYVYIDPALNFSACWMADKWIPVLPNTDAALYLAIAYVWLTEDTYDKDYLKTHAVGTEPFFDYVLGKEDGEPKTPAWASDKCGVPEWTIKALARDWARKITSVTIGNGGPTIRGAFSTEPARLQSILLGMQGLGKPGVHQAKWLEWNLHTAIFQMPFQGQELINIPHRAEIVRPYDASVEMLNKQVEKNTKAGNPFGIKDAKTDALLKQHEEKSDLGELADLWKVIEAPPMQSIPRCMIHEAILKKEGIEWWGLYSFIGPAQEQWSKHVFPRPGCSRLHMIWTDSPCNVTCWNDGFSFVKAFRDPEIECIVAQHPWLENDCYMADIILPVKTKFEMEDVCDDMGGGTVTSVFHEYPACPPVGESLNDFECVAAVAKKIGDDVFNAYTGDDKALERVVELMWQGCGVAHFDVDDEYHKNDIFIVPTFPKTQEYPAGLSQFCEDPETHPLTTPTGKLEFTSTDIAKHFPDDPERPPYPKWIERSGMHDDRLSSVRAKAYPYLCMSNHGRWRFHANCDDITWNREIGTMKIRGKDGYQYEPAWMHTSTAKEIGVAHGDIIKVFNERGVVLCAAYVTERLIPKTIYVDHGARFDPIDAEGVDRGGAINLISPRNITSKHVTGMVISGFLVGVDKVTDAEMEKWKATHPEAFARKIDEACGVCLDGWLVN